MKKFILAACALVVFLFAGYYAYYHLGIYFFSNSDTPVTTFMKTDEDTIYMERDGVCEPFEIRGVNLGVGIPGHFATNHSHVNYYIDLTAIKHRCKMAEEAARTLSARYVSTDVDTIICMDGCEMIGGYLASFMSQSGTRSINSEKDICVITPEFNSNSQLVFRDNI